MRSRFTLGNLDKELDGPANPSATGQLFTAGGDWKFTDHQGTTPIGPLAFNNGFSHSCSIRQTLIGGASKGVVGVKHGFCDEHGNYYAGTTGQDQDDPASITLAQWESLGRPPLYWKAEYFKPGAYNFAFNKG